MIYIKYDLISKYLNNGLLT